MKVLVIPDVHLKPWMFQQASVFMKEKAADLAVCLMDLADDWNQEQNLELYASTFDAAIQFARDFPETLWCYGNHDVCYLWNQRESGYSSMAKWLVCEKLGMLQEALPRREQLAFLHRIDNVLFCHGGLADEYIWQYVTEDQDQDTDEIISRINGYDYRKIWQDLSPIWYRPQYYKGKMYRADTLLQVVGHTPVDEITKTGNVISCDVFSTYRSGDPIGTQEFLLLDTETWEYRGIKAFPQTDKS